MLSAKFALTAAFMSAFAQFQNSPHVPQQRFDEIPHRLAAYYTTHAARDAGELIVGYLHHEDPRFRRSDAQGFRHRADAAIMRVLTSPDEDGNFRIAYAPIAGSLSAGFVGSAMYRHNETLEDGLMHAGFIYSKYFLRSVLAEFKPDINAYARHILRRDKN
jgi:hypothetical protein